MPNALVRKLESFAQLSEADKRVLNDVIQRNAREVGPRTDLIREGDKPEGVHLILEGFACRYKILPDGTRQIMAYMIPGDFCDLHIFILREMDHSVATLSHCREVEIPRATIIELTEDHPRIARAFWWATLVDEAILRQWLISLGRRDAGKRLAHLICELLLRLQLVGLVSGYTFELPLTQEELADTLGMSGVHLNRMLQDLRRSGMIELQDHSLVVLDRVRLQEYAGFDPNYLHLREREGPALREATRTETRS
jgi:CRP-like cAMP-binding protein